MQRDGQPSVQFPAGIERKRGMYRETGGNGKQNRQVYGSQQAIWQNLHLSHIYLHLSHTYIVWILELVIKSPDERSLHRAGRIVRRGIDRTLPAGREATAGPTSLDSLCE